MDNPEAAAPGPANRSPAPPLTERQRARRRRILHATARLACRGGFEAVQMREVAESSEVALGTLYRYFPSKVHLLVATMQDQLEQLHGTLRRSPPAGETAADRVAQTLMRAFGALQREPRLAEAMARALTFADRSVSPRSTRCPAGPRRSSWTPWAAWTVHRRAALGGPRHRAHLALDADRLAVRTRVDRPGGGGHRDGVPAARRDGGREPV